MRFLLRRGQASSVLKTRNPDKLGCPNYAKQIHGERTQHATDFLNSEEKNRYPHSGWFEEFYSLA